MKLASFPLLVLALLPGCERSLLMKDRIPYDKDTDRMKTAILQQIPVGTPSGQVIGLLEKNNIEYELHRNEAFAESSTATGKSVLHENIDYIYIDHETGTHFLSFVAQRWQIGIVLKEDRVADVLISYGLTGL